MLNKEQNRNQTAEWTKEGERVTILTYNPNRTIIVNGVQDGMMDDEIISIHPYRYPPEHIRDWAFYILARTAKDQMLPRSELEFGIKCGLHNPDLFEYTLKLANEIWEDGFDSMEDLLGPVLDRELKFMIEFVGWICEEPHEELGSVLTLTKVGQVAREVIYGTEPFVTIDLKE